MRRFRAWAAVALFVVAGGALACDPVVRWWRAAELLLALSAQPTAAQSAIQETELVVAGRDGPIRARLYRRADVAEGQGLVLSHGVHYRGIDERRLVPFARELSRAGLVVLTPELDDLTDYRITQRGLHVIKDSALWLAGRSELVSSSRVGLLGFSFAGGLSLVAAADAELDSRLAWVTSVGGHHDLARVMRFLLSDRIEAPEGVRHGEAHEYGLVVLLYQNLEAFVPEADISIMQQSVRTWLQEEPATARAVASLRTTAASEELFSLIEQGRLQDLAPRLTALIAQHPNELAALSPSGRLSQIRVPVYLLHGSADSVIPPSETEWAARELGSREHRALVSPLLEHVEVAKTAGIVQQAALVDFMAKML